MTNKLTALMAVGALAVASGGVAMAVAFGTVDVEEATDRPPEAHPVAVMERVPQTTPSPTPSPDKADDPTDDPTDSADPTPDADPQPGTQPDDTTEQAPADSDPYGHDECRARGGYIDVGSCVLPGGEDFYQLPDPDGRLEEYRRGVEDMSDCVDGGTSVEACADQINPPPP